MYYTGDLTPGGAASSKIIGLPRSPVDLFVGSGVLDPPMPTMGGDWYLQFPIIGPFFLGFIPENGVLVFSGTIPGTR